VNELISRILQRQEKTVPQQVYEYDSLQFWGFKDEKLQMQWKEQRTKAGWSAVLGLSKRKTIPMWSHCWIPIPIGFIFHDGLIQVPNMLYFAVSKIPYFQGRQGMYMPSCLLKSWWMVQQPNLDHAMFQFFVIE
jgi:hypothetical protein